MSMVVQEQSFGEAKKVSWNLNVELINDFNSKHSQWSDLSLFVSEWFMPLEGKDEIDNINISFLLKLFLYFTKNTVYRHFYNIT